MFSILLICCEIRHLIPSTTEQLREHPENMRTTDGKFEEEEIYVLVYICMKS